MAARWIERARATVAVLAAARRLGALEPDAGVAELAERMRRGRPLAVRDPALLASTLDRLLPRLPPRRMGPCLERSLLLVNLWSRCGLEPRLHLGVRLGDGGSREAHAWVTVAGERGEPDAGREFAEVLVV